MVIVISEISNEWEDCNIEFHFFQIDNDTLIWVASQQIEVNDFSSLAGANYNSDNKQGVFFSSYE